ncbi:MAG TPA: redoxin family protein, partial [Verrucomicrobiae bacterium]|nr:redoxin family protein [Verrucomicrobiae bacterium]
PVIAASGNAAAAADLRTLIGKIQPKIKGNAKVTEADLAAEIKEFDALLEKYKGDKSDDVAQILVMKSTLYSSVLGDEKKGAEVMEQLVRDFPDSEATVRMKRQAEAKKRRDALVVGSKFPDFEEKDLAGKPLSIAGVKGKVVLIDFWATWCGPCVAELPNVLEAYEKHHASGFEIIGISLDRDRQKLESFIKEKNMTWPQFFDGKFWENKLSQHYGINSIPATYLLDSEGTIIATNLRGKKLEEAVAKALAKK